MTYLNEVDPYIFPLDWSIISLLQDTTNKPNQWDQILSPRIVVSVEEGRSKQEVNVVREGAHFRRHLTSIPHCRTKVVILVPWV